MTRLNHTGRARIHKKSVDLGIREENGVVLLAFRANLGQYGLPPSARVVIEARRQTTFMRMDVGKVSDQYHLDDEPLDAFGSDTNITFTLKVVSSSSRERGRVLGLAKGLRPNKAKDDRSREGILPFRASDDLGSRVWRLDLTGEEPIVLINRSVGDWVGFAKSREFCALVYPELVRAIALWEADQGDDDGDPRPWRKFLRALGYDVSSIEGDSEAKAEWAEDVAGTFSTHHHLLELVAEGGDE